MLDRRKMLMCLSKREVKTPKDRDTKRKKAVADGGLDTLAIEAKKPKSQEGESVTSILAEVPLEENERSQGWLGEGPYRLDSLKAPSKTKWTSIAMPKWRTASLTSSSVSKLVL